MLRAKNGKRGRTPLKPVIIVHAIVPEKAEGDGDGKELYCEGSSTFLPKREGSLLPLIKMTSNEAIYSPMNCEFRPSDKDRQTDHCTNIL